MSSSVRLANWTIAQLGDLSSRCYLITGGNSGIGFATAEHLRRANADVIIGCRSADKGQEAVGALRQIRGTGAVHTVQLDLANMESVRRANDFIRALTDGLDGVVNNAGIMATPQRQTADGFELQFGTNHLGHFLLDQLVFDLVALRSGRIVPVSSVVHRQAPAINFDDPMLALGYSPSKAYVQSKLANLMFGLELARRLEEAKSNVMAVCAHPGYSATNLQTTGPTGILRLVGKVANLIAMRPSVGSLSEVLAVAGREARNGAYYGPTRLGDTRGPVGESRISEAAKDRADAERLWTLSEELLEITWTIR